MARRRIEAVQLVRQPHRDGLKRLQLAYQRLIEATETTINMKQVQQTPEQSPAPQSLEK